MDNIMVSVQRILRNKNVITIIGVILMLVLLYVGYSSQIKKAVQPISVPVATETIQPRTEITESMVQMVDMPSVSVKANVLTSKSAVVGKYSNVNSVIPEGSMFYADTVITKDELPDSVFVKVKSGEIIYNFPVNMESTYGNSIFPGNKIDIYMKTGDGNEEKVMLGKLVENVEILAVKDSAGRNVFENTSESRTPAMLLFGLPEKVNILLRKASYMENLGVELFPVPHGGSVSTEGATEVSTQQLADYIEAHAVNIPLPETTVTDELAPTVSVDGAKITIKYPSGCKKKYTCEYAMTYDETSGLKSATGKVTKTSQTVNALGSGVLTATVTETDGTTHVTEQAITLDTTNTTNTTTNTTVTE